MSNAGRPMGRGPMRSWLKLTLESGVLETLRPSEATGDRPPTAFALDLLATLRQADGAIRADDPAAVAFHEFRSWVESTRRAQRLRLQGDSKQRHRLPQDPIEDEAPPRLDDPASLAKAAIKKAAAAGKPRSPFNLWAARLRNALTRRVRPEPADVTHPMWDRWIDG